MAFIDDTYFSMILIFVLSLTALLYLLLQSVCIFKERRRCIKPVKIVTSDEVIFITGCDSGIGFQLAKFFDRLGFRVYAGCLKPSSRGVVNLREETSSRLQIINLDITDETKVDRAFHQINSELRDKGLWCLINNAGVLRYGDFQWLTWDQCMKQVDVNLIGTLRVTKTFMPLIIKRQGRIVAVTSVNGLLAYPLQSVYCATKFALEGFCDSLRMDMRRHGVHVATIQLGDFSKLTEIMNNHVEEAEIMWASTPDDIRERDLDYFNKIQEKIKQNKGLTCAESYEQSPLFYHFEHVVIDRKPNNRYLCMSTKQKIIFSTLLSLPRTLSDAIIGYIFQKILQDNS